MLNESSRQVIVRLPRLHVAQTKIVRESRRFNIVCCGRRFGKSVLGIDRLVRPALEGKFTAYFCPTYKMLAEIWRETRRVVKPVTRNANATDHRIELITGGIIDMWSLEAIESVRGRKYHRVVPDEAAMCANLKDAWQEVIRPTLTDYAGDAWFLSTPKGINFFKELFDRGQDPSRATYASWQMPTLANPYILPSEVEAARMELPAQVFQQEYLAEFLQNEGAVFRNIEANLTAPLAAKPDDHAGHRIVMGVDWAQKNDFTCLSVFCATCMTEVELDRFNKIEFAHQRGRLRRAYDFWRVADVLAEENSIGAPNIEALIAEGIRVFAFSTTAQTKAPLIQSLALSFERREARWQDIPVATAELVAYESTINPTTGRVSYNAPAGLHDDTVIARALARRAAESTGGTAETGEPLW
jgi:hypothetical protein